MDKIVNSIDPRRASNGTAFYWTILLLLRFETKKNAKNVFETNLFFFLFFSPFPLGGGLTLNAE